MDDNWPQIKLPEGPRWWQWWKGFCVRHPHLGGSVNVGAAMTAGSVVGMAFPEARMAPSAVPLWQSAGFTFLFFSAAWLAATPLRTWWAGREAARVVD